MPARSDLDPAEIPILLPFLLLVEKAAGDQLRYRLVGTAVVQEVGRDLTGDFVGSYVSGAESAARMKAIYERALTRLHPVFATGRFFLKSAALHSISLLVLPLSDDGACANMTVASHVARFSFGFGADREWLREVPAEIAEAVDVSGAAHLERMCHDWERGCEPPSQGLDHATPQ